MAWYMGHRAAQTENWEEALKYFQSFCEWDIRSGCKNMRGIHERHFRPRRRSGQTRAEKICVASERAVTCDIQDLSDWDNRTRNLALWRELNEIREGLPNK